jgi:diacylglycerol O-acyltransferase
VVAMERLTAEEQVVLWPDKVWPQEIGALATLDGSGLLDPDGRFQIEAIRRAIAARLHLVPRFRQLLYVPRRGLGGPLWIDAPAFDLTSHVQVAPLPAPGDEAALLAATEQLRRRRLDRSRPLWQMWFLPGLPGNRVAMFVKIHHVIADGIAGVATIGALLDTTPNAATAPTRPSTPAPAPTARELLADNLRQRAGELGGAVSALTRPAATARHAQAAWRAMRELSAAQPAPATSLNRVAGPGRNLALIRTSLDQVKQIAHSHGAKVNDVLLAVTAGGLRGLLRSRGEHVDGLTVRTDVPVTLRPAQDRDQARGNLIGQFVVPLPIGVPDPGQRLAQIATMTAARKAESHHSVGTMLRSRIARRALLKTLDREPINLTSADVPGPPEPVYLAGARLLEVFPVLPLVANVSLAVGAISYAGQFSIAATADKDTYPDLGVFAASATDELRALAAATTVKPAHQQQH